VPRSLDRPGEPPVPDQPDLTEAPRRLHDLPAMPDRGDQRALADAGRWSKADLRQRLEHLPPGHPSSLRSDDLDRGEADAIKRDYWSEMPGFVRASEDHIRRWPTGHSAPERGRSVDLDGSWRGDGDRYLSPGQHKQAEEVILRVRRREEAITERIEETGRDNLAGAWTEGLEFRLKGEERLKEKIADLLETGAPDATSEEIMQQIPDAIRYTFCAEAQDYKDAYSDIRNRLEACGYHMYYSRNHWSDTQYKGINTRWVAPDGQQFEVQFHTPESFHAKQTITHTSYERLRSALTSDEERKQLMAFQREVCSWVAEPESASDIPNYGEKGR
jgi:hypothetical protein